MARGVGIFLQQFPGQWWGLITQLQNDKKTVKKIIVVHLWFVYKIFLYKTFLL